MNSLPVRNSVKILLINEDKKILLMCADDPKTTTLEGVNYGVFWFPIGGEIEPNETLQDAAVREVFEETGITTKDIELGPIVWHGEFDIVLAGKAVRSKERFIVAKTKQSKVSFFNLTEYEKSVIKKAEWFSIDDMERCKDIIFPVLLPKYLPDILEGNYPKEPIEVDLAKQPD